MDLRKKLLNLDDGLNVYNQLLKDEDAILIPFAFSVYVTVCRINELLPEYLADLNRNECKEPFNIDFDRMTSLDYWMDKLVKLRSDMEMLGTVPMKEHGFVVTILGFSPETTMDLYRAIEKNIIDMVEMVAEVQHIFTEEPVGLYRNFYLSQKADCDAKPVKARYKQWKREVGVVTTSLLEDKRMQEIVWLLEKKILRFTQPPSKREIKQVDFDEVKNHLPDGYELTDGFEKCCARLRRYISWEGDILQIDYDKYGSYLFQHYYHLNAADRQAIFELDIMLDLIHRDMKSLGPSNKLTSKEDCIRRCIALLMKEQYGDEPLFNQRNHWQAVYRGLVDKKICRDSDFDGFDAYIKRVMPDKVNKSYSKASVKQISQTVFIKPFKQWKFDPATSTRKPFERMVAVARRFMEILEEHGL
ncbi:MAG: hypothetical protein J5658_02500 [Prevotella sp.]|nr:hypothetical protein [Prevotella sp.]